MKKTTKFGAASLAVAVATALFVATPASAGIANLSYDGCGALVHNASTYAKTQKSTGSCGVLSVRAQLRAHSGGHTFWTTWSNSAPGASHRTYNAPQQTTLVRSQHGIHNQIATAYLDV